MTTVIQGGHTARYSSAFTLDLATCVNPFGPPHVFGRTADALQNGRELRLHPFEAAEAFRHSYARKLGVAAEELIIARGITELIHVVKEVLGSELTCPTPDYTDLILGFPLSTPATRIDVQARYSQIVEIANQSGVIFSNPCNPTGLSIPSNQLVEIVSAYPSRLFIIDESYVDFTSEPETWSMVGAKLSNILVLRSPTKCMGMGGVRVGAAWIPDSGLRARFAKAICKWPLSTFDALFAQLALEEEGWRVSTTKELLNSAMEMEVALTKAGFNPIHNVPVHFRFVPHQNPRLVADKLSEAGVIVRVKSAIEGICGLRFVAPLPSQLSVLISALEGVRQ